MNGKSVFRRTAGSARGPGGSRGPARLGVRLALGALAALAVAVSAGTSPAAAAATRSGLSSGAAHADPGPLRQVKTGSALRSAGLVAGSWRKLPPTPVGGPATQTLAVWTGSKVIIYGIRVQPGIIRRFNVAYRPASGTWQQLARGPAGRQNPVSVWTGHQMIVWGGFGATTYIDGAAFTPRTP